MSWYNYNYTVLHRWRWSCVSFEIESTWWRSRRSSIYALRPTIPAMAMKCALGFWFETLATKSRAVAFTPPKNLDEFSWALKTSSFSKSKFLMATLCEWRNLMWDVRCMAVHIVSTIESVECTQLHCEECTQLRCAERTRLRWLNSAA